VDGGELSFIRDENQQPIGILGVSRDITNATGGRGTEAKRGRYRELSIIDDLTSFTIPGIFINS